MKASSLLLILSLSFVSSCQEEKNPATQSPSEAETDSPVPATPSDRKPRNEAAKSARKQALQRANIKAARETMVKLIIATDNFYETYQYLPGANLSAIDASLITDKSIIATLLGERSAEDENPKLTNFLPEIKLAEDEKNGLVRTPNTIKLLDPWGNHYNILMNYDCDNRLVDPLNDKLVLFDRRAVAWSTGPDGKSGTPETNQDNVWSWNRD